MPYGNTIYTPDHIRTLLSVDDGRYMGNHAPAPHALGLHGVATATQMLDRVAYYDAARTSRFENLEDMIRALHFVLSDPNHRATLLTPLDGPANSTTATVNLPFAFEGFIAQPAPGGANPKLVRYVNGRWLLFDVFQSNRMFVMLRKTPLDQNYAIIQTCYPVKVW